MTHNIYEHNQSCITEKKKVAFSVEPEAANDDGVNAESLEADKEDDFEKAGLFIQGRHVLQNMMLH